MPLAADLFHLAVHPEHRQAALVQLLDRSRTEPIFVLCEKPDARNPSILNAALRLFTT